MLDPNGLNRSQSVKDVGSRKKSPKGTTEVKYVATNTVKPTFVQFRVTSDNLQLHPAAIIPAIPARTSSQRNTRLQAPKQSRPGSYQFDVPPTLVKTPWEHERSKRPASQWSRNKRTRSLIFGTLPREILSGILDQLKCVHSAGITVDVKGLQQDLSALCVTDKRIHRIAREHMYRETWLPRNTESKRKSRHSFRKTRSPLKLFLRTLDEAPRLAEMVRHIHITTDLAAELRTELSSVGGHGKLPSLSLLEQVVLKCHNLEQLSGYVPPAARATAGLLYALSTCFKLKSHAWRLPHRSTPSEHLLSTTAFVDSHSYWRQLETLVISQGPDGSGVPPGIISTIVPRLPSLKHLMVKGLLPTDFHSGTLLMLPPLKSLRLEHTHGVTDQGIEQLAHSRMATSLERLTLYGLELTSLRTVQTLLANLSRLEKFSLLQDTSPELELQLQFTATSSSFSLGSRSLRYLHWDIIAPGSSTTILANSIAAGKFPSLRIVKVPCDYDGAVQKLCRPIAQRPLNGYDIQVVKEWESMSGYHRSLSVARIQAQIRIRESRRQPSFEVVIQDEDQSTQHTHVIGSYLGSMASPIEYSLGEAVDGTGFGIAHFEDVSGLKETPGIARGREQALQLDVLF